MPLLCKNTTPLWGIWKVEESPEELYQLLEKKSIYQSFYESKATENRKREWLAVRVLLKELLGDELPIAYHPNGAPYLPEAGLNISISHTKGYVAVILGKDKPVGIDIEYKGERILKVRSRFMTSVEEAVIDHRHEIEHLLLHWCAKETLFKLIGQEDVDFQEYLHVKPFIYQESGNFTVWETRTPEKRSFQLEYRVTNDFIVTYTS